MNFDLKSALSGESANATKEESAEAVRMKGVRMEGTPKQMKEIAEI